MSDTPEQPPPVPVASTAETAAVPAPVQEKALEMAHEASGVVNAAESAAPAETFDNPQFRHGEFTPYVSPAAERPPETTADTPPPAMAQPPTEEVQAAAPVLASPARPVELTANAPPSYPEPLPTRPTEVTANERGPTSPSPAAPLPAARLPSPPPPGKGAPIGAFAGFTIGGYVLGVLSAVAVLGSRPPSEPFTPPPPPIAAATAPPASPSAAPAAAVAADDVRVPEAAAAPQGHHEREHEHEGAGAEHHHSSTATSTPPPAPTPTPSPPASGALKVYETATLAEALQAAKQANNALLVTRLTQLIGARQRAEEAKRDKDAAKESASVDDAYRVDLSIDRGAGPYHRPLQEEAVRLHLQLGERALARRDTVQASAQFRQALTIEPDSAEAKKKLAAMGQKP